MRDQATVLLLGAEDEENLAVRTLAAFLRERGANTHVIGFSQEDHTDRVLRAIKRLRPELIAISMAFQCLAPVFFILVEKIRKLGYKGHIVVGGHFPTFDYQKILETQPGIDSVGRFEGEHCLGALVEALREKRSLEEVPNLVYRTADGVRENVAVHDFPNLDRLPFPVREKRPQTRVGERFATLASSRGCWHSDCLYCCIGAFHRNKAHKQVVRSAESVAEELAWLHLKKGVCLFQFHDDNFVLPSPQATCERIHAVENALRQRRVNQENLAFLIKARPDTVDDSVAEALAAFGCVGVFLGVENASASGLRALIRGTTPADAHRALDTLLRHGMIVTYNLLIFHPHATMQEIEENLAFVKERDTLPFDFGRAEILAGSPLERMALRDGRLRGIWPMWDYTVDDPAVQRMFEVNTRTFRLNGSPYAGLVHSLIALSYHAYTLNRLHRGPAAARLVCATRGLTARVNHFVIECLEKARDLAESETPESAVSELSATLKCGCLEYQREVSRLTQKMLRLQMADRIFQFLRVRSDLQTHEWLCRIFGCHAEHADPC